MTNLSVVDFTKKKEDNESYGIKVTYSDDSIDIFEVDSIGESVDLPGFLVLANDDGSEESVDSLVNSIFIKKIKRVRIESINYDD